MSIAKLPSGKYQAKIQGGDGSWISRTFNTRKEADAYDREIKNQKWNGTVTTLSAKSITMDQFFDQ